MIRYFTWYLVAALLFLLAFTPADAQMPIPGAGGRAFRDSGHRKRLGLR